MKQQNVLLYVHIILALGIALLFYGMFTFLGVGMFLTVV